MDKAIELLEDYKFVNTSICEDTNTEPTQNKRIDAAIASLQAYKVEMEKLRPAKILKACPADCKQQEHCIVCCRMYHDQYKIQLEELDK